MGFRYGEHRYSEGLYSRWPDWWHDKRCLQDEWADKTCRRPTWIPTSGAPYVDPRPAHLKPARPAWQAPASERPLWVGARYGGG